MKIEEAIKTNSSISLHTKTVINISYTARMVEEILLTDLKEYDLTIQQFNVLRILRGQKSNPANLSTIQERMVDRNSNVTRLIDKLIKKDLVKRQVCKANRRKIEVFITESGLKILKDLDPTNEKSNKDLFKNFTETEMQLLNTLLDKVRNNQ